MRKLILTLLIAVASIVTSTAAEQVAFTCSFSSTSYSNGVTAYNGAEFTNTCGDYAWTLKNFNNNNKQWNYVKCGDTGSATLATITTNFQATVAITKIVVTIDDINATNSVNSIYLETSSDNTFASPTKITSDSKIEAGKYTFSIPVPTADLYYRIVFDCKKVTKSNRTQISKIEYYEDSNAPVLEPAGISYPVENATANLGEEPTDLPVLNNPNNLTISYTSSDPTVAKIDAATGAIELLKDGKTEITATSEKTETYAKGTAKYTLTVIDPNKTEAEFNFENMYTSNTTISSLKVDPISIAFDKGNHTNTPPAYNKSDNLLRFYGGNTATITAEEGFYIEEVICVNKKAFINGYSIKANPEPAGTTTFTEASITYTWTAAAGTEPTEVIIQNGGISGNNGVKSITVKYAKSSTADLKPAGLSYAQTAYTVDYGSEFSAPELVNPNGLAVTYSSSKEDVATVDAEGKVTIKTWGETTISAKSEANEEFRAGEASYTLTVVPVANSLAQFIEMGTADSNLRIKMACDLTVTYVNGNSTYVTDGTSFCQFFRCSLTYEYLDVIPAGWSGTLTMHQGVLPEIENANGLVAATEKGQFTPAYKKIADITDAYVNEVVMLANVTFGAATPASGEFTGTQDGATGNFYNSFTIASTPAGEYNVLGVVNLYKGNNTPKKLQIYPISYETLTAPEVAPAITVNGEPVEGTTIDFKEGQEVYLTFDAGEDYSVYYKLQDNSAAVATYAAEEGYTLYEQPVKIDKSTDVRYYTENKATGARSAVEAITFNGITTGIDEINVSDNAAAEYFDLTGRRVDNPSAGLYIKKVNGKAEKTMLR